MKISGDILFDSNLIVYSSNKDSPKYKDATGLRQKAIDGDFNAFIAHQNIFESLRVLTHKAFENTLSLKEALQHIDSYTNFCYVITPTVETKELALSLISKYKLTANKIFDAYLVATMLSNGVQKILTDNTKDMRKFKEIKVINPFMYR